MLDNTTAGVKDYFLKNLFLTAVFFLVTPVTLTVSLISLLSLEKTHRNIPVVANLTTFPNAGRSGVSVYASLPSVLPSISGEPSTADARTELIRQYLLEYRSPLAPHAETLVQTADKHQLDYRLLTAIAQQESNLCKIIPPQSFNCWGWGIHSKGSLGFSSYEEAIETVSQGIKENYINKGYLTIEDIMSKYTPLSKGSWAEGVNQFMTEVENPSLSDTD